MQKTAREKAVDKVLSKACTWKDRKFAMRPLSGQAKEKARTRLLEAEFELSAAAEEYEKTET